MKKRLQLNLVVMNSVIYINFLQISNQKRGVDITKKCHFS